MATHAARRTEPLAHFLNGLMSVSATALANGMQKITSAVMAQGAVVITKHDQPSMVLLSMERYALLKQASEPDLGNLTDKFEQMYTHMQQPGASAKMAAAFDMSPSELGRAAVKAASAKPMAKGASAKPASKAASPSTAKVTAIPRKR